MLDIEAIRACYNAPGYYAVMPEHLRLALQEIERLRIQVTELQQAKGLATSGGPVTPPEGTPPYYLVESRPCSRKMLSELCDSLAYARAMAKHHCSLLRNIEIRDSKDTLIETVKDDPYDF